MKQTSPFHLPPHTHLERDAFKTATKQQQKKKKKRKMVRFFAERKTKATRTGVARRFPTFAHRSQNGGADAAKILRVRAFSFVSGKNHTLEKCERGNGGVDATVISERGKDFGESGRPTKRTMR